MPRRECPDRAARASPVTHVDSSDPPFLIIHGSADCSVATGQSQRLFSALQSAGVEAQLIIAEGAGHNVMECNQAPGNVEGRVIAWVEQHMRSCDANSPVPLCNEQQQDSASGQSQQSQNTSDQSDQSEQAQNGGDQSEQMDSQNEENEQAGTKSELAEQGDMQGQPTLSPDDLEDWASEQAAEQWLRRIPQDPGGLLRRKFLYQYQRLGIDQDGNYVWPGDEVQPW